MFKYGGTLFVIGSAILMVATGASELIAVIDRALAPLTVALGGTPYLQQVIGAVVGH